MLSQGLIRPTRLRPGHRVGANAAIVPADAVAAREALAPFDVIIGQLEIPQAVTAVTLGARSAALLREDGRVTRIEAEPVRALDTTGAGDAFIGAFAFGLARRLPAEAAVRLGVRCATDSVLRPGTQASFPRGAALEPLLAGLA